MTFTANELAILVPTKDRPDQMREMLSSVQAQNPRPSQIVIVASGKNISFLKDEFSDLNIDYYHVEAKGQIYQRSFGINKLKSEIELVCLLDDDHYLLPDALKTMLDFWNKEPNHGAVCFNIVNEPPFRRNFFKYLFKMVGKKSGEVTRAAYNTKITNVSENIKTDWVMGGLTVWKRKILDENPYEEWDRGFPENEDVYFSFPLSKKYSFAVCAKAKAEHRRIPLFKTIEFGETFLRRRFTLARKYPYFSMPWLYWASIGQILENFLRFILNRDKGYLKMGIGNIKAVFKEFYSIFSRSPQ